VRQLEAGLNTPQSPSVGRLFDAVASLCGLCARNDVEGQAARTLQRSATNCSGGIPYAYDIHADARPWRLDWRPMIRDIVEDLRSGAPIGRISERFHATLIDMFALSAVRAAEEANCETVVLSGGCFANELLREGMVRRLADLGLVAVTHQRIPTGDAGLSLGQAVVASRAAAAARNSKTGV